MAKNLIFTFLDKRLLPKNFQILKWPLQSSKKFFVFFPLLPQSIHTRTYLVEILASNLLSGLSGAFEDMGADSAPPSGTRTSP